MIPSVLRYVLVLVELVPTFYFAMCFMRACILATPLWNFAGCPPSLTHSRDVPDIHPVPGKGRVFSYSVLTGPRKKKGPKKKKKKKIFFYFFFTRGINDPLGRQKL